MSELSDRILNRAQDVSYDAAIHEVDLYTMTKEIVAAVLRELAGMDAFPDGYELADEIEGDE